MQCLSAFTHLLGPDCDQPVPLDHTHRVFSQDQQQKNLPPDVLIKVHYFHIKEKIMQAARQQEHVVFKVDSLSIYQVVSIQTLARRGEFRDVTLHLCEHKIVYLWGFPLRLHFTYQDKQTTVEADEALGLWPPWDGRDYPGPAMPSLVDRGADGDIRT
ncbi:hypothetical protein NDU88_003908 [Pleurodeles waltl]|uniref:Uncharacterized protein n=1 Tax=Pleurodeles waltl TaxID=8319 RepID=A0AAV7WQF7_PLEWA|nr:hypothetical protein NDU88_003908 [Pleurodeles waltl]